MAQYEQDDDMLDGRSMGQFIILPDGKLLVVNGGKGMAAYSDNGTGTTTLGLAHPRYPDYHSTLLPDALVTIAESNPNPDIVMDALYRSLALEGSIQCTSVLTPLQRTNYDDLLDPSTANLNAPYALYRDNSASGRASQVYEDGRYSPSPHNLQPMVPVDNCGHHDHPPTSSR